MRKSFISKGFFSKPEAPISKRFSDSSDASKPLIMMIGIFLAVSLPLTILRNWIPSTTGMHTSATTALVIIVVVIIIIIIIKVMMMLKMMIPSI